MEQEMDLKSKLIACVDLVTGMKQNTQGRPIPQMSMEMALGFIADYENLRPSVKDEITEEKLSQYDKAIEEAKKYFVSY